MTTESPAPDETPVPASGEPSGPASGESPPDARNGMAIAALVVGVLAVIAFPVGWVVGLVALGLGGIALVRARHLPAGRGGKGIAIAALCLAGMSVIIDYGYMHVIWPRTLARGNRVICASNLRGVGQGLLVYTNDNAGMMPILMDGEPLDDAEGRTAVSFVGQMGASYRMPLTTRTIGEHSADPKVESKYDRPITIPGVPDQSVLHPSRSLFFIVMDGTCAYKQFHCPASEDVYEESVARDTPFMPQDFAGYPELSYGYQLPYGRFGRPSTELDARMPIMADKGPLYRAGKPRADGTVPDEPTLTPGAPLTIAGVMTAEQVRQLTRKQWRPYNSRNHDGEGQNVLRVDGSVEFEDKPIVGVGGDNIYTMQGAGSGMMDVLLGLVPADRWGPRTNTDSVIVP